MAQALSAAEKAVVAEPTQWRPLKQLASMQLRRQEPQSARALLSSSISVTDGPSSLQEYLPLAAIAEAHAQPVEAQKLAGKAVVMSPWLNEAWLALAYTRSCAATA